MEVNEYQKLAERTECNQDYAFSKIKHCTTFAKQNLSIRLLHSVLGMAGEVGELAGNIERWLYYGQDYDEDNLKEELGDLLWYIAEMCNAADIALEDVMYGNIQKLRQRYPEKFDTKLSKEENRDRKKEMRDVCGVVTEYKPDEQTGQGWTEPPEEAPLTKDVVCPDCGLVHWCTIKDIHNCKKEG